MWLVLVCAACREPVSVTETAGASRVERTCAKDEAWVEQLMAQTLPGGPPPCVVDDDCACGSFCNSYGSCDAECVTTAHPTYGCAAGRTCDSWGACVEPAPPPPPPSAPALRVEPHVVAVAAGVESRVDVALDYAGATGPSPVLAIAGPEDRVPVCEGRGTCPNPRIVLVRELEVRCDATSAWAESCALGGPWSWQPGGAGVVATKPIWVRRKPSALGTSWLLRVTGAGATANDESVTVVTQAATTVPFEGRYRGQLTLASATWTVEAVARGSQLVVIDPTRTVAPTGKLPLGPPATTSRFTWLGDADGAMIAQLDVDTRGFDPAAGSIDTAFRLTLPIGGDGRPGTATRDVVAGHATLRRIGPNDATTCAAPADCTGGTTCEPGVGLCLPGAASAGASVPAPVNGLADPAIDAWSAAVRPRLTSFKIAPSGETATPDAIERLSCFDPGWGLLAELDGVFTPRQLMTRTGDLRCASDSAPWTARATIRKDAGDTSIDVGDLLLACAGDLETPVPASVIRQDLATNPCLSLARLIPGLDLALDGAIASSYTAGSSSRHATLAQYFLRSWLEVAGFVMQQGEDDVGLAASVALADGADRAPLVPLSRLLDRADQTWKLMLDARTTETLASLAPNDLRLPDYRRRSFAAMHWPGTSSVDAVAGRPLARAPHCGSRGEANSCDADQTAVIDPREVDLTGDASVAFHLSTEAHRPYQNERYVIDSPALSVRLKFDGVPYRERNTTRNAHVFYQMTKSTWYECRQLCAAYGQCVAWTFDPSTPQRCKMHDELGAPAPKQGAYSGVLELANHQGTPAASYTYHALDTLIQGNDLGSVSTSSFSACFDACSASSACVAASFTGAVCYLKSAVPPLFTWQQGVQTVVMPTVSLTVSHLTSTGQSETVTLALPHSVLGGDSLLFDHRIAITRNATDHTYRAYVDGVLRASATYTKQPGRWAGHVRIGRRDPIAPFDLPDFEAADEVGLWTTALDAYEILAIQNRCSATPVNCLTRGPLTIPANPDHDQPTGIAATMLETLDRYHRLLGRQADAIASDAYAVCTGELPASAIEPARARIGDGLRRSLLVDRLASELEHRAREVECDSDADCGAGATCGAGASYRIDALAPSVVRGGAMQACFGPNEVDSPAWPQGLCTFSSTVVTAPGTVGTATFTFDVAKAGSYGLWGRVYGAPSQQAFWIRLDGGPWTIWNVGSSAPGGLHWHSSRAPFGVVALAAGTHTVVIGVREGGTVVDELALEEAANTAPDQRRAVCVGGNGAPIEQALPWQGALDSARAVAAASRERLEDQIGALARCEPPMGLTEIDAPLFFTDPGPSAFDRYFAASTYLLDPSTGRATTAASSALAAVLTASQALDQRRDDQYQRDLTQAEHELRLAALREQYDAQLGLACGPASNPSGGLLAALSQGTLDQAVCFLSQTAACLANAHLPVRDAQASCYSGALGEATLALKGAALDVEAARLDWNARQDELDRKSSFCAELEETGDMIARHRAHMDKLRKRKAIFDTISGVVKLGASIATGGVSSLAARRDGGGWGVGLTDAASFLGAFGSGVSLLQSVMGAGAEDLANEQASWDELMQARSNELEVVQCWDEAAAIRSEIGLAQNRIERATSEFELAAARLTNTHREVSRLVQAGTAELARETASVIVRPQRHDWLDQRITSYERTFAWAKRMTYVAVRAVEHDFQHSTGAASAVLAASNPFELQWILEDLDHGYYTDPLVCGGRPQGGRAVVRLTTLAGLAPGSLGAYLRTDQAVIRDAHGTAIGRGVRFAFAPTSATGLTNRSSERIWGMTGSVQVDGEYPDPDAAFSLYKRATFFSRWCGDPMPGQDATFQIGIHRPRQNLFADTAGPMTGFADALAMQPSTIQNLKNIPEADLRQNEFPTATVNNFAGQGLFGDYVVMFATTGPDAIDFDRIEDVLLRFDYVYVDGGPTPGH